jgi:hypothetical protein
MAFFAKTVDFCGILKSDKSWVDPAEAFVHYTRAMKHCMEKSTILAEKDVLIVRCF